MKRTKIFDRKLLTKSKKEMINSLTGRAKNDDIINIHQEINSDIGPLKNK
jgi:hypothetical protein